MYASMHVLMDACKHVCTYASMQVCMDAIMHVCMYAHVYTRSATPAVIARR